jgi:hypothetical protein
MKKNLIKLLAITLVMGFFVGCSDDDETTTPTATPAPTVAPTATPAPTDTPSDVTADNILPK